MIDKAYEVVLKNRAENRVLDPLYLARSGSTDFQNGVMRAAKGVPPFPEVCVETTPGFATICGILLALEAKKGVKYAGSWIKRGEREGALPNVERKVDRLSWNVSIVCPTEEDISGPDGRIEALADLAVYAIKWLTYLMETHSLDFEKYLDRIQNMYAEPKRGQ